MNLESYLAISAVMFSLGIVIFISRKNSIAILMGVELLMNAAALNFVAFSHYSPSLGLQLDGQLFAVFIIILAAAEAVTALAIVMAVYKQVHHIRVDEMIRLHG